MSKPRPEQLSGGDVVGGAVGEHLYLFGRSGSDDTVQVVDSGSRKVVGSLSTNLGLPARMAVSPDGQRIYLSRFFEPGIAVLDSFRAEADRHHDTNN